MENINDNDNYGYDSKNNNNEYNIDNYYNERQQVKIRKQNKNDRKSALPSIRFRKREINSNKLREIENQIRGRKIINRFNFKIIKDKKWGDEDEDMKKERGKFNFIKNNNVNQDINNNKNSKSKLLKIGEHILNKDNNLNKLKGKFMFRSSSAGNIF